MAKSKAQSQKPVTRIEQIQCPYCQKPTRIEPADDYRPIYGHCRVCGKRFIAERIRGGIEAMKVESAPSLDDPDRREIELGQGDEE
jgi:hypothetical protein